MVCFLVIFIIIIGTWFYNTHSNVVFDVRKKKDHHGHWVGEASQAMLI